MNFDGRDGTSKENVAGPLKVTRRACWYCAPTDQCVSYDSRTGFQFHMNESIQR